MNIILLEKNEVGSDVVELTDHRATHIVKVLGAIVGDVLQVGVVNGNMGTGEVIEIHKKRPHHVLIRIDLNKPHLPEPPIDLVLALPRPIMLKRVLSQVTALGVGKIFLINANRVEKSFWNSSIITTPELYREHLVIGLEQCVDTKLPEVSLHNKFKPFVEDYIPKIFNNYEHCVLADPSGELSIQQGITKKDGRVLLAVGPEGGWVEYEIEKFEEYGFSICNMGDRILKVDTAVIALHAYISAVLKS